MCCLILGIKVIKIITPNISDCAKGANHYLKNIIHQKKNAPSLKERAFPKPIGL
jgi:hypothetical protein